MNWRHRRALRFPPECSFLIAGLIIGLSPSVAAAEWRIVDHGSPWNSRRPLRPRTDYIVLHTTEGAEVGSLHKLANEGEAHYLVGLDGTVHRVVDRRKLATHAGRSMWEGRTNIDEFAIGIEVVGYHDEAPKAAQLEALRELLRQLKSIYNIPDHRVLTHSMVAYGAPNRWHRRRHRGRKRCAMRLAEPRLRRAIGLRSRPRNDPDVSAGRLAVADKDLFDFLFPRGGGKSVAKRRARVIERGRSPDALIVAPGRSPWDIAKEDYNSPNVEYLFPDGRSFRGNQLVDWKRIPAGTELRRVNAAPLARSEGFQGFAVVGTDGDDPRSIAGDEFDDPTTIYIFPDGLVRTGAQLTASPKFKFLLEQAPKGAKLLVGYQYGGYVTPRRPPSLICGHRWNFPSTFYRLPDGRILSGDQVDAAAIPKNTLLFFRK